MFYVRSVTASSCFIKSLPFVDRASMRAAWYDGVKLMCERRAGDEKISARTGDGAMLSAKATLRSGKIVIRTCESHSNKCCAAPKRCAEGPLVHAMRASQLPETAAAFSSRAESRPVGTASLKKRAE